MPTALLVDDDRDALDALVAVAESEDFSATTASSWGTARAEMDARHYDVVLLDVLLPGGSGFDLLLELPQERRSRVVLMSGDESVAHALGVTTLKELRFLKKPIVVRELRKMLAQVRRACGGAASPPPAARVHGIGRLIGESHAIRRVRELIAKAAPTDLSVYVEGESGTGKELVAKAIHELSRRSSGPFVAVNCGAIPDTLIDGELFGHEKGSFTGAIDSRKGVFEQADGGTLFLDEIIEMPMELQVRLLRVLESKHVRRVGGAKDHPIDIRVIAATNRSFEGSVSDGRLREDLFHRLAVFPIALPPLRDRVEDIEPIARHMLKEHTENGEGDKEIAEETLNLLGGYIWPGNVRQLRNVIQHAYVMADKVITADCLPPHVRQATRHPRPIERVVERLAQEPDSPGGVRLEPGISLAEAERRLIESTLTMHGGNKRAAAETLGISLRTLYNRLASYSKDASAGADQSAGAD